MLQVNTLLKVKDASIVFKDVLHVKVKPNVLHVWSMDLNLLEVGVCLNVETAR